MLLSLFSFNVVDMCVLLFWLKYIFGNYFRNILNEKNKFYYENLFKMIK